jgi:uncharacterized protein
MAVVDSPTPVLRVRRLVVPPTWPALSVLHLSDLHLRRSDLAGARRQLQALSRLERIPDLVCVTGDLCEQLLDTPLVAHVLAALRPRLGTFLILGNHEYGAGAPSASRSRKALVARAMGTLYRSTLSSGIAEGEAIAGALSDLGLRVLGNAGVRLRLGDRSLWLAGIDSGWAGRANAAAALYERNPDEGSLVMVHEPELAFSAVEHGADVVLAGHTHGGQVCLPFLGAVYWHRRDSRLKVAAGVQSIGAAQLHISAGMGQFIPFRFRCPPELVWLDCVPLPGRVRLHKVEVEQRAT